LEAYLKAVPTAPDAENLRQVIEQSRRAIGSVIGDPAAYESNYLQDKSKNRNLLIAHLQKAE